MTDLFKIDNLDGYREGNRIEAKKAKSQLPASIWETYSAFANTDGGIILLGVSENSDHSLKVTGVEDAHKLQADFWNTVNNRQKVSINVLTNKMVYVKQVEGKDVIVINVPKVDRKQRPVFIGLDPMKGTYRRDFEGDYLCATDEVAAMYRDASDKSLDLKVLKAMDISVFDMDTLHRYRNRFRLFHPAHVWNDDDDEVFLRRIGAMSVCDEDMQFHPTAAGLLMFGREYDIVREFPDYFLDYQEKMGNGVRWTHRMVSSSGDWSGNLYDFFFRVYPRITADLPVPFVANGKDRIDETDLHLALREVLLNICAHSDHYGRQGIVVVKAANEMTFANPGDIRIGLKAALTGGVSDPRNVTIMKMFSLVDIGERAGSGIPEFLNTWLKYVEFEPSYEVTHNPERTKLIVPYTLAALQKAGEKMANIMETTTETIDNTTETAGNTTETTDNTTETTDNTTETIDNTTETAGNTTETTDNTTETADNTTETADNTTETVNVTTETICKLIKDNPKITAKELAVACGITEDGVAYHIKKLKTQGRLVRIGGSRNGGEWRVQKG